MENLKVEPAREAGGAIGVRTAHDEVVGGAKAVAEELTKSRNYNREKFHVYFKKML